MTWRLLLSSPANGAWNMAVDEAILQAVACDEAPPTLRLYAWSPPCLSLGYSQSWDDIDMAQVQAHGWDVVRRPTGGRAILHTDELTYAIIAPTHHPLMHGGVLPSYRRIARGLLAALRILGIEAQMEGERAPSQQAPPVCFEVPSSYEITVNGRKLLGSAQARSAGAVLQHGTLPLWGDIARVAEGLRFPDQESRVQAQETIRNRATTVSACLGREVTWQEAANAFQRGFEEALGMAFTMGVLTESEYALAATLRDKKYASEGWTRRRQMT